MEPEVLGLRHSRIEVLQEAVGRRWWRLGDPAGDSTSYPVIYLSDRSSDLSPSEGRGGRPPAQVPLCGSHFFFDRNIGREAPTVPKNLLPKNKPHKIVQKGNCPKKPLKRSIYLYKAK
jgi:hypothetical protein